MSTVDTAKTVAVFAAVAVGGFVAYKAFQLGKGALSGDNAITRGATDASGKKTDAYVGVPVLGTVGAVTNAASGGYLASLGSWIGTSLFDAFNPDAGKVANAPTGGPVTSASYDETDRLSRRYPAPDRSAGSVFDGSGSFSAIATGGYFDLIGVRDPAAPVLF